MSVKTYPKRANIRLSPHFTTAEFDCKCRHATCRVTYVDEALVLKLEEARAILGCPIYINSGFRCTYHNQKIRGKPGSQHLQGKAVDITTRGKHTPKQLVKVVGQLFDGVGVYPTWVHVDTRGYPARW